jgi:hypothetical protein
MKPPDYTPEQDEALTDLFESIQGFFHATGQRTPCVTGTPAHTQKWVSDKRADQREAITACETCPILTACETYITQYPHEAGIYAGTTQHQRVKGQTT